MLRGKKILRLGLLASVASAVAALLVWRLGAYPGAILESQHPTTRPTLQPAAHAPLPAPEVRTRDAADRYVPGTSLILLGTFAYDDPATGSALLGQTDQSTALYRANAEIAPGVILREVYANRIVIEHDGLREVLTLASRRGGAGVGALASTQAAARPEPPAVGMHDTVRVAAVAASDEMQGVRVFPGRNRNGFAQLGLHPGDLVTEIDGVPVVGPQSGDLVGKVQSGTASTATVFRAGRLQQIVLHPPPEGSATSP